MSGFPWMQFYPRDWTAGTRMLTIAAKGAWIDIIAALHDAPSRGTLTLTVEAWSRLLSTTEAETGRVLTEIQNTRVGDVVMEANGHVMVSCRRMLREEHARDLNRKRVARHRQKKDVPAHETGMELFSNGHGNESETEMLRGRSKKLEARDQKTDGKSAVADSNNEEWLKSLKSGPAYQGIDVMREHAKMLVWCANHRKQPTRKRFVNWLNRCEVPIGGTSGSVSSEPDNFRR